MKTPPTTYVALLRGVNVGSYNRLLMAELRAHFEALGYLDVRTFIQSGNVIFRSAKAVRSDHLEAEITNRFDIATPVVLRTARQFSTAVRRNPFPDVDRSRLHLGFLRQAPTADAVARLELEQFTPDEAQIVSSRCLSVPAQRHGTKQTANVRGSTPEGRDDGPQLEHGDGTARTDECVKGVTRNATAPVKPGAELSVRSRRSTPASA